MEIVSVCCGKAWRLRIWTHDPVSTAWVLNNFGDDEGYGPLAPRRTPDGTLFEQAREYATENDPLLELSMRCDGPKAEAWGCMNGTRVQVSNHPPPLSADVVNRLGDSLRVASVEDTLMVASNWLVGLRHIGCIDAAEPFASGDVVATAYRVQDVEGWIEAGTPLPATGTAVGFIAFTGGPWSLLNKIADTMDAEAVGGEMGGGLFMHTLPPGAPEDWYPPASCLVAVGSLEGS